MCKDHSGDKNLFSPNNRSIKLMQFLLTININHTDTHTHTHSHMHTHMSLKNEMFRLEMHDLLNLIFAYCQCLTADIDFFNKMKKHMIIFKLQSDFAAKKLLLNN